MSKNTKRLQRFTHMIDENPNLTDDERNAIFTTEKKEAKKGLHV